MKNILVKLLFAIVAFLVCLFIVDLYIRNNFPLPEKGYGVWAGYPESKSVMLLMPDKFKSIHRYNRYGFRGDDFIIDPHTDVRIACVGDSFTEGYGANENETWPAILQSKFNSNEVEVLNLGKAGSQSDIYANIINKVALPLHPTDIIVSMITSDFRYGFELPRNLSIVKEFKNPFIDNRIKIIKPIVKLFPGWVYLLDRARGRYPMSSKTCWPVMTDKVILQEALDEIPHWNHLSYVKSRHYLEVHKKLVNPEVMKAVEHAGFNPYLLKTDLAKSYYTYLDTVSDMGISKNDLQECTDIWIKWYANICKKNNIRAWVLYFPLPPLVNKGKFGIYQDKFYENAPDVYGDTSVRDIIKISCEKFGVNFIDPTREFMAHGNDQMFHRWDTHPTAKGYKLVGELVSKKMMDK